MIIFFGQTQILGKPVDNSYAIAKGESSFGQSSTKVEEILRSYNSYAEVLLACFNFANVDDSVFQEFRSNLVNFTSNQFDLIGYKTKDVLIKMNDLYSIFEDGYTDDQTMIEDLPNLLIDIDELVTKMKQLNESHKVITIVSDSMKSQMDYLLPTLEQTKDRKKVQLEKTKNQLESVKRSDQTLTKDAYWASFYWYYGYYKLEEIACNREVISDQKQDLHHDERILQQELEALNRTIYVLKYLEPTLKEYLEAINELSRHLQFIKREIQNIAAAPNDLQKAPAFRETMVKDARRMSITSSKYESAIGLTQSTFKILLNDPHEASHIKIMNDTYYKGHTIFPKIVCDNLAPTWTWLIILFVFFAIAVLIVAVIIWLILQELWEQFQKGVKNCVKHCCRKKKKKEKKIVVNYVPVAATNLESMMEGNRIKTD
jgi:hypothetical protein